MGKYVSNIFLGALAIGLSIFTGSRTLDLLAWALPANQVVYQWLGLAAFELGMYFWSFYFIAGAKGTPQRSIAVIMAVFSIVAVAISTITDMSLDAGQAGKIAPLSPVMSQAAIIFLGIVIALNVAAFLACKLMSIDNLRLMKEQSAEDTIHDAGLRAITAIAPSIASAAAPHLAEEWANRTWDRIVPGAHGKTRYIGAVQAEQIAIDRQESIDTRPQQTVNAAPVPAPKRGILGWFKREPKAPAPQPGKQESIDTSPAPSEHTSHRLYRDAQRARRAAPSSVAAIRMASRQRRYARTYGPNTEKVAVPPLAGATLAAEAQTSSTPGNGSRGKKRVSAPGATRAK